MRKLCKWFLIVVVIWVCFGVAVALVRLARGEGKFCYQARFTEFYICEGPDPITELPREPVTVLPSTVETIYARGNLETLVCEPLHFILFYEGRSTRWFDPTKCYQPGWAYKELPRSWRKPGNYRVEVRSGRRLVASTGFTIVP